MNKRQFSFAAALVAVSLSTAKAEGPSLLDQYLAVFESKTAETLPLAENASFNGPLLSRPIVGRGDVAGFLTRVSTSLEITQVIQRFETLDGACAELVFYFEEQDFTVDEVHCLTFEDGQITSVRLYFDPSPFRD